jgi:hypothetical protein
MLSLTLWLFVSEKLPLQRNALIVINRLAVRGEREEGKKKERERHEYY